MSHLSFSICKLKGSSLRADVGRFQIPQSFQTLGGNFNIELAEGQQHLKPEKETQAVLKNTFLQSKYLTFFLIWHTQPGETLLPGSSSWGQVVSVRWGRGWPAVACGGPRCFSSPPMPSYPLKAITLRPENITKKIRSGGMCAVEEGEWCVIGGKSHNSQYHLLSDFSQVNIDTWQEKHENKMNTYGNYY